MTFNRDWEEQAQNQLAWARTPGHDVDWHYRSEFFGLVPPAARATLEIGCGEGRVPRDLAARGHRVTAVYGVPTLFAAAPAAHPSGPYLLADAADLPLPDALFDVAVAYSSLMDVHDMGRGARGGARPAARH